MATTLIAATANGASQTFTVADGTTKGIFLIPATGTQLPPEAEAAISYMSGTDPINIGVVRKEGAAIGVAGTYSVSKLPGIVFGVVSEP